MTLRKRKLKIFLVFFLLIFIFSLNFVLSYGYDELNSLGTFKEGDCLDLKQTCANCTYNNISRLMHNNETLLSNVVMNADGTYFSYPFCNTNSIGDYSVYGYGDDDGVKDIWIYTFEITPSGFNNLLGFFIVIIFLVYGIAFIGFFGRSEWISIVGGMAMMLLGIFIISYGIDVYRNFMTNAFSYFTIALGAIFTFVPLGEILQKNY